MARSLIIDLGGGLVGSERPKNFTALGLHSFGLTPMMPELLLRAHELSPRLPVIVVTGADSDEGKFLEEGAFGYLLKPFRFEEVENLVGRATGVIP